MAFLYRRAIPIWMSSSAVHLSLFGIAWYIPLPFSFNRTVIYLTLQIVPSILYWFGLPTLNELTGFRIPVPTSLGLVLTVIFWSSFYWLIALSLSQVWKLWRLR